MQISEMMYQLSKFNVLLWNSQILDMKVGGIIETTCFMNSNLGGTSRQGILLNNKKMYKMHLI